MTCLVFDLLDNSKNAVNHRKTCSELDQNLKYYSEIINGQNFEKEDTSSTFMYY